MNNKILMVVGISAFLCSACSMLNVGKNDFSCPGKSNGVSCASTREMYEATNNGAIPKPVTEEEVEKMAKSGEHVSTVKGVEQDTVVMTENSSGEITTYSNGIKNVTKMDNDGKQIVSVQERIEDNFINPALPNKPIPIRTPSVVMRIWIAPWEDELGDLNYTGYIYTEIEPRRWIFGKDATTAERTFNPLQKHSSLNN